MKASAKKILAILTATLTVTLLSLGTVTASAAPLSPTATSSGSIGTSGTNATSITVTVTAVTGSPANLFNISLPTGWSFVTPAANCNTITITGLTGVNCQTINFGPTTGFATIQLQSGTFSAGQVMSATFAANTINVAAARDFRVQLADSQTGGTSVDSGTATIAGGVEPTPEPGPTPSPSSQTSQLAQTGTENSALSALGVVALFFAAGASTLALRRRNARR